MSDLNIETIQKVLPSRLKGAVTPSLVQRINNISSDPVLNEQIKSNILGYTSVLQDGKYKTEEYVNAVIYVSYKLMGYTNLDSYIKTFPQRYQLLVSKGTSSKDIAAYVTMYNKGKLVNKILEQTLVPTWVLNQDIYQKAINTQAELMVTSKSEKVRAMAADSLLTHLAKPEKAGPLVNIDMTSNTGLDDLKETICKLAEMQQNMIKSGKASTKEIAEQQIQEAVIDE